MAGSDTSFCAANPSLFRSSQVEAANLLNLNNVPFMGRYLKITRPKNYTGVKTRAVTWQEVREREREREGESLR